MPDVCFTPPENMATPPGIPIPYPNTGLASDTTGGSKKVKITDKEVGLKNKSCFKKSSGDEAGSAAKKGIITSKNTGKVYFNSWSMDVMIEGQNAVRHLDLTTNNHASLPGDTPPWPYMDAMAWSLDHPCIEDIKKEHSACNGKSEDEACEDDACQKARKCMLLPYRKWNRAEKKNKSTCCDGQSGHHLLEDHGFCSSRSKKLPQFSNTKYSTNGAPCVCATSPNSNWEAEHGDLHCVQGVKENYAILNAGSRKPPRTKEYAWNYGEAKKAGVDAHAATFNGECNEDCISAQLDNYYKDKVGIDDDTLLRTTKYGFADKVVDQLKRGVELIKKLADKRIGQIVSGPF
jgi:hypothetical protein